jgi:YHS domain-containing protein
MNILKIVLVSASLIGVLVGTPHLRADDNPPAGQTGKEKPKPYPLKTCIVSGEKLEEMGNPTMLVYKGQEIKFCCKDCIKDFNKNPDKFIKKLKEETAKAKKAGGADSSAAH